MSEQQYLLEVQNIYKKYSTGLEISNINFSQKHLQKIAIVGESGSGKTTLLKIISGCTQADNGRVLLNGSRVVGPDEQLLPGHPEIAYLSQHYELLNNYRVEDLIWFDNKLSSNEASHLFEICNISHLLKRKTNQLSGGEKQRIALCKLLIKKPKLLVLDEPFSNLDLIHKSILKTVLRNISAKLSITCLLASHDPHDILSWADEVLVMKDGQIVQQASAKTIYYHPVNEYVAAISGNYNLISFQKASELFSSTFLKENKHIFLRPEQLQISNITDALFAARVVNISFYGNFYLIDLVANDIELTMQTHTAEVEIGETIGITIDTNNIHFI